MTKSLLLPSQKFHITHQRACNMELAPNGSSSMNNYESAYKAVAPWRMWTREEEQTNEAGITCENTKPQVLHKLSSLILVSTDAW